MIAAPIFVYVFVMWVLMLAGGGILVLAIGPISIVGHGDLDPVLTSVLKAVVAVALVVLWVLVLSQMKRVIFDRMLKL